MDDLLGQSLGPYQLLEAIGAGAMATVYKGYHPTTDRFVALKVLPDRLARDATFRSRFLREARTIARLEHRYILPIYDFGEDRGIYYLVMRYVNSGTLGNLIDSGTLTIERAVRLVAQLGEALAYAHEHGVIHRDIKPANVLIGQDGNVFLSDFGIAKVVAETLQLTGEGQVIGTPAYMAPEQVQGLGSDARTDIYALGVLLYQAVTSKVPFSADTAFSLALMHIHAQPRPPRELNPALPEALERVILRAMAKDPADRFQHASAMVAALQASVPGVATTPQQATVQVPQAAYEPVPNPAASVRTVLAAAPTQAVRPPTPGASRPALLAIALVVAVLSIAAIAGFFLFNRNDARETAPTAASANSQSELAPTTAASTAPPTIAPTAQLPTAAPTAQATSTPSPQRIAFARLRSLASGSDWLTSVAFSPDGQLLAVGSFGNIIQLWHVADGQMTQTLSGHTGWVWNVAFSPDGQLLASASEDATVRLWRVSDGALLHTLTGHRGTVSSVAFAPDGQTLVSAAKDQTVKIWRVADGSLVRTLAGHSGFVRSVAFSPDGQTIASGADDRTIKLWRASDGALLRSLEGHSDAVYAVAFDASGQLLCSGSVDTSVRLWRVSDGKLLQSLSGHHSTVNSVAFSPDGVFIASSSYDLSIKLWRASDGALLQTLDGHKGTVYGVAFAPNGHLLASASQDQTVILWETQP